MTNKHRQLQKARRELAELKRQLREGNVTAGPSPTLPDKTSPQLQQIIEQHSVEMSYSGVHPPPWILAGYEKFDPGRSAKLFNLAEDQSRHRMKQEDRVIGSDISRSWAGLASATGQSLLVIGLAAYALYLGQAQTAGWMVVATVGANLGAFIYGKYTQTKERTQRAESLGKKKK